MSKGKMISAGFVNWKQVKKDLNEYPDKLALVEQRTISDLRSRLPGKIASATAKLYALRKQDVMQLRNSGKKGGSPREGAVSLWTQGKTISDLTFIFRGTRHANWPTTAGGSDSTPPTANRYGWQYIERNGRFYWVPKPYTVTREVLKGQVKTIKPEGQTRIFVLPRKDGGLRVMAIKPGQKYPVGYASTALPHAIIKDKVIDIWRPQMNELILKRFEHQNKRIFKEN